ncbi:hypothetical protein PR003_g32479 [Phytophthora rubi]|uniref:Uncharacterized protein n=1 Tax=Phytophthora rubi TaxID=129364 RepID=A0A6A4B1Z2_9STRA|nr:hypothetical protein PR003_g32479 [Phytophthora rubi]
MCQPVASSPTACCGLLSACFACSVQIAAHVGHSKSGSSNGLSACKFVLGTIGFSSSVVCRLHLPRRGRLRRRGLSGWRSSLLRLRSCITFRRTAGSWLPAHLEIMSAQTFDSPSMCSIS